MNYLKQVAQVFGAAWNGRKYSIKSAAALRAFVRVAPDVVRRLDQEHADRTDFRAIGRVIAPWGRRIGDLRFETEGRLEALRDDGGFADEGTAAGAAVSRRRGGLTTTGDAAPVHDAATPVQKEGASPIAMPPVFADDPAPQQLTAPCRKYSGRLHPP